MDIYFIYVHEEKSLIKKYVSGKVNKEIKTSTLCDQVAEAQRGNKHSYL